MKRFFLILSTVAFLATLGCNNSSTKNDESSADSLKQGQDISGTTNGSLAADLKNIGFTGTEPFWNLTFKDDYAEYSSPMKEGVTKIYYRKDDKDASKPKLNDAVKQVSEKEVSLKGIMDGVGLTMTIKKESCNDGMSAESYPYSISFTMDKGEPFSGCGKKK
jgi:uncharacterized membrane protein